MASWKRLKESKNGDRKSPPKVEGRDLKILVIGDQQIGKSTFIKAFAERLGNKAGENAAFEYTKMYQCRYDFETEWRNVKILEVNDCRIDGVDEVTKLHYDSNGLIIMYAIDNPAGFQNLEPKWFSVITSNGCWKNEPAILVGNKRDLREDQRVVQRLARVGQVPVTEMDGANLARKYNIRFYECSSLDENDQNIHDAFHYILSEALQDWIRDEGGAGN